MTDTDLQLQYHRWVWKWRSPIIQKIGEKKNVNTFLMRSLASMVRYGGRLSLHFRILSMVFFLFSAVNGGWGESHQGQGAFTPG